MDESDHTVSGSLAKGAKSGPLPEGLMVALEVIEGPDKGTKFDITRTRTSLGRKDADVKLSDPTVSGVHALIEYVGGKMFITDMESTNGTELNGRLVESAMVGNLDEIKLGDTRMMLSIVEDKYGVFIQEPEEEETDEGRLDQDESTWAKGELPNPEIPENLQVVLEVVEGPEAGRKFKVKNRSTVIGRGTRAELKLEDSSISKRHCQLEVHNKDKMTIKDLASSNGTRLNDRYISAVKIRHGDLIRIGETKIKILVHIRSRVG